MANQAKVVKGIDVLTLEELKSRIDSVWSWMDIDFELGTARDCLESMADADSSPEIFQVVHWPIEIVNNYVSLLLKIEEHFGPLMRDPRDEAEKAAKGN